MPDILSLDHEDHHFRHGGGVVGDPLQVLGYIVELQRPADGGGVLHHEGEEEYPNSEARL